MTAAPGFTAAPIRFAVVKDDAGWLIDFSTEGEGRATWGSPFAACLFDVEAHAEKVARQLGGYTAPVIDKPEGAI